MEKAATVSPQKERPLLFSGPMVLSILTCARCGHISVPFPCERCGSTEFRKTQTRRVVKPQPQPDDWEPHVGWGAPTLVDRNGNEYPGPDEWGAGNEDFWRRCPYGKPGDRLWVRETFIPWRRTSIEYPLEHESLATSEDRGGLTLNQWTEEYGHHDVLLCYAATEKDEGPWMSPIFMPRWASRLTLEITEVRVQRLQEISAEDAIAEGIKRELSCDGENYGWLPAHEGDFELSNFPRNAFATSWRHINGAGSWDANPWVWALTFRRLPA